MTNVNKIIIWELKINKGVFLFYLIIIVLLFSISVSLLGLAFNIPVLIAGELKAVNADNINITNVTTNEAERVLAKQVELLDATVTPQDLKNNNLEIETDKFFWGGVLLDATYYPGIDIEFITKILLTGMNSGEAEVENGCYPIWIERGMAEETGLNLYSRLLMFDFNGIELCNVYVAGIFESADHHHFYISQYIYSKLEERHLNMRLSLYLRPLEFNEFNHIISWAEKNKFHVHYNRDIIFAVQMVYYTFFVLNFILLLTLVGIIYNMIRIYFSKREKFYAMNLAIGMTPADILKIIFYICQILIFISVFVSFGISYWISNNINSYVIKYFEFADIDSSFPLLPLLLNWLILQMLTIFMLLRFSKTNRGRDIVSVIRHNK